PTCTSFSPPMSLTRTSSRRVGLMSFTVNSSHPMCPIRVSTGNLFRATLAKTAETRPTSSMTSRDRIRLTPSVPVLNATLEVWKRVGKEHNLGPVVGQSMRPLLHEGDLLRVRYGSAGARRGDIVVFRRQDTWIAHRVLRVERHAGEVVFWPKGDNTGRWDGP